MKQIIYLLIFTLFCSCSKVDLEFEQEPVKPPIENLSDSSMVTIGFRSAMVQEINSTKSNAERDIYDLNIYLLNTTFNTIKNYYLTAGSNTLNQKLANGNYEVYVIGNWGSNLGVMTKTALLNLQYTVGNESQITANGRMVMSSAQSITISRSSAFQIPLNRLAAKVNFNISMSPAMAANSKILSVQPYNCNGTASLFANNREALISYPTYDVSLSNLNALSKSYYFMENLQGKNNDITVPSGRTKANSPANATYLVIRVERNKKLIDYRIYLGENDTNDFNVNRNTNYNFNIVIAGENPMDLRLSSTSVIFYSGKPSSGDYTDFFHFDKFVWNSRVAYAELDIITTNNEPDNQFYVSFYKGSGTFVSNWTMEYMIRREPYNYLPITEHQTLLAHTGNGKVVIFFAFWNGGSLDVHTTDNLFYFTVSDRYGYRKTFTLQTSNTL